MLGEAFADEVVPTRGGVFGRFCVAGSGAKVQGMDDLSIFCARAVCDGCDALEVWEVR